MIRTMVFGAPVPAIRWMIRILTVIATRMISVKYAVRNGDYIESAETGNDQHGNGKKDSDCFHKNAPLDIKLREN